jgi:hypothetical protein
MRWVEVITLRSLAKVNPQLLDQLLGQFVRSKTRGDPPEIRVYHHSIVETDLSIHIHWETKGQPPRESPLGQQLSYALKGLGLLNHSVWVEAAVAQ